jgi:DNA (cytosine-5)-methyltransferase 1
MASNLTFGSLFTGIGGFDLGFERAGMECKWQVEIDEACNKVLKKHWPNIERYKDVREVGKSNLEPVDVICGGFPCQDVSLAGSRKGLEGKRSTLWTEFYRIICEIRPKWIVIENVPGLLSSDNGRFFGNILGNLASIGYDAEWQMLPAAAFGASHIRQRIFIVAYSTGFNGYVFQTDKRFQESKQRFGNKQLRGSTNNSSFTGENEPSRIIHESTMDRMANGLSSGLDSHKSRLKQCGNAVVPQMAEWIGKRIIEVNNGNG